jgi:hypothetical protein
MAGKTKKHHREEKKLITRRENGIVNDLQMSQLVSCYNNAPPYDKKHKAHDDGKLIRIAANGSG